MEGSDSERECGRRCEVRVGEEVEAEDELASTSGSFERAEKLELSVCAKTRQLSCMAQEDKVDVEDDGRYHSVNGGGMYTEAVEKVAYSW